MVDAFNADDFAYFLANRQSTIDPRGPNNPLYRRLTQLHGSRFDSITLRKARLWALGLAIVSLIVGSIAFLSNWGLFLRFSLIVTVPMVVFFPFFSYIITMVMVSRDTRSETYDLIFMSDLSNEAITWGYFRAGLFRLRVFYIVVIALLPLMVIGLMYQHVYAIAEHHAYYLPPCGTVQAQNSPFFGPSGSTLYPSVACAEEPITNNEKGSILAISVALWMQIVFLGSAAPLATAYAISLTLRRRYVVLGGVMGLLMVLGLLFVPLSAFALIFYGIRARSGISQLALVTSVVLAVIGLLFPPFQRYYSTRVINHASRRARAQLE